MPKKNAFEKNKMQHETNPEDFDLQNFQIQRGETQKNVNYKVLEYLVKKFKKDSFLKVLDLPCGTMLFLGYLQMLFPRATLLGADLKKPAMHDKFQFTEMDLTKDFTLPAEQKFDLITSISGVMMFSNTLSFIVNCAKRLNNGGTFIVTNDNSATIKDKLAFLFLGRHRIFKGIYEDSEELTQNISIQELCRLLRTNGLTIEKIMFTSLYKKDLLFLPIVIFIYPLQWLYLMYHKTRLPSWLKWQMFPFEHYFCRHYIIVARKDNA